MSTKEFEKAGFKILRSIAIVKPEPRNARAILLLQKQNDHYICWAFEFPAINYTEPVRLTESLMRAGLKRKQ